ncbi:MAG: asparagine synthase (glutamine-hydrolyzing) [Candidatus Electryonea clarkiae]|nr:asparagine synthase (glutamine-hydrolyzing) [Candidatus Electryonea clarkiae]MDP8289175.1 asparagine synthase (glutamine-hydrolyzing) [Candidatus Electryonea clarkiae]
MCGICGVFNPNGAELSVERLEKMNDIAVHRGPDEKGLVVFTGENGYEDVTQLKKSNLSNDSSILGFGHQRLSIIDLSELGRQPMFDNSKRYCIVFNGEIYNYVELREELESLGYKFTSQSDTEVILAAYKTWGVECQRKFNGMWAFAIFDQKERTLFCSRDRFGIKPFYYTIENGCFIFASEIKQLLEYSGKSPSMDDRMLAELLFWGFETHTDQTFYKDIYSLPQSQYLMLQQNCNVESQLLPHKYWSYELGEQNTFNEAVKEFRDLFIDSVRLRLRSDVPVGVSLSGGLDSSSVACVMSKLLNGKNIEFTPTMFTCDYGIPGYSENVYAESVISKTEYSHFYIKPSPQDLSNHWEQFVWHMEEPFSSLSYFSNYLLMRKIGSENVKVIMNGQGGDELLMGYERYRAAYNKILFRKGRLDLVFREIILGTSRASMSMKQQILYTFYFSNTTMRRLWRSSIVKPYLRGDFYNNYRRDTKSITDSSNYRSLKELLEKEFFKYQLQHLLRHEDRVSMAHSVEVRLPFLDYRLYNLILSQDEKLMINSGWSKIILRKAMDGIIPDFIRDRTNKMGYSTPIQQLFRNNEDLFRTLLRDNRSDEIIDTKAVEQDFINGKIDPNLLCSILTYLQWRKIFHI